MDLTSFILIILALIIGFFLGKYFYDKAKWSDKKRLLDAEWKNKFDSEVNKLLQQLKDEQHKHKTEMLELQKNQQIELKKVIGDWQVKYVNDVSEIKSLVQSAEKYMRLDAVKRSKRTLLGKMWEQVSPYLPNFPFKPSDMKFLGAPIDFIIFDGASEGKIEQVIFLEVKSGNSKLNTQERRLKKAIEEGNVIWKQFNVDKPDSIQIEEDGVNEEMAEEYSPHELYDEIDSKVSEVKSGNAKFEDSEEEAEDDYDSEGETTIKVECPHCGHSVDITLEDYEVSALEDYGETLEYTCSECNKDFTIDKRDL